MAVGQFFSMYIHIYIHTYVHTYIYTYIHTYIHTQVLSKLRGGLRNGEVLPADEEIAICLEDRAAINIQKIIRGKLAKPKVAR